ncbi:unnamed protein product [Diplocarpon coronariae]
MSSCGTRSTWARACPVEHDPATLGSDLVACPGLPPRERVVSRCAAPRDGISTVPRSYSRWDYGAASQSRRRGIRDTVSAVGGTAPPRRWPSLASGPWSLVPGRLLHPAGIGRPPLGEGGQKAQPQGTRRRQRPVTHVLPGPARRGGSLGAGSDGTGQRRSGAGLARQGSAGAGRGRDWVPAGRPDIDRPTRWAQVGTRTRASRGRASHCIALHCTASSHLALPCVESKSARPGGVPPAPFFFLPPLAIPSRQRMPDTGCLTPDA